MLYYLLKYLLFPVLICFSLKIEQCRGNNVDSLFEELISKLISNSLDEADIILEVISQKIDASNYNNVIKYYNAKYYYEASVGNYAESKYYATLAYDKAEAKLNNCSASNLDAIYNMASVAINDKKYKVADILLDKLIGKNKKCNENNQRNLLLLYQTKAYINYTSGQFLKAIDDYKFMLTMPDSLFNNEYEKGTVHYNLAGSLKGSQFLKESILEYDKAFIYFNSSSNALSRRLAKQCLIKKAEILIDLKSTNKAMELLLAVQSNYNSEHWNDRLHMNFSKIYSLNHDYPKSREHGLNSIVFLNKRHSHNSSDFHISEIISEYLRISIASPNYEIDTLFELVDLGFDILLGSDVNLSTLQKINTSNIRNIPIFIHLLDSYIELLIEHNGIERNLIELFKLRQNTISQFYSRYGDNSLFLQNGDKYFENIESIFKHSKKLRTGDIVYLLDASKLFLLENERSKFYRSRMTENKADSILKLVVEYDYLVDRLKVVRFQEKDSTLKKDISLRIFQLNSKRDLVMRDFALENNNDFDAIDFKINQCRLICPYLRFYQGVNSSFSFFIMKDTFIISNITWEFEERNILRRVISNNTKFDFNSQNFAFAIETWAKDLKILGDRLIPSRCFSEDFLNLTIIPDGTLNYLPFELLLTEDVDTTKPINWFDLPYLFKKVNINYQYSARLAAMDRETNPKNNGVLAFAPKYKGYVSDDRAFGNLIYNQRELESIKKYFPGEFYGGADADKKTFLEKASDFKVIHLASHAMADNENPELSSLFFTDINQDSTQSPLYPYEIQSTPLNADLVVLSACQSGTGKLHRGEGVFSLARNFIAAGAKSVVNSLWKVDDESTSRLMGYFYENLAKGQRKSEALRNAKLTFLENADAMTSHPYFWSGFVLIGDDSPIVKKSNKIWWIPGGLLLLIAVGWITHKRINPKVFLYQAA